jgi:hypothetical protein
VRVEVVGYLAHHAVDRPVPLPENLVGNASEMPEHRFELVCGRFGAMAAPDDHGDLTYLALGYPAQIVGVEPRGQLRRFAELADAFAFPFRRGACGIFPALRRCRCQPECRMPR